jgi:hypothetical protein
VERHEERGAHDRVDTLEVELGAGEAAARHHQVHVVVVASDLRRRLARERILDDLGRDEAEIREQLAGLVDARDVDVDPAELPVLHRRLELGDRDDRVLLVLEVERHHRDQWVGGVHRGGGTGLGLGHRAQYYAGPEITSCAWSDPSRPWWGRRPSRRP